MMFCLQCGKEIADGSKFCPYCGAVTSAGEAAKAPSAPAAGAPGFDGAAPQASVLEGGKKGISKGLIAGGAAAVVVVVLAVVLLSGLFSSPKGTVGKAVGKTLAAYSDAGEAMGIPDLSELAKSRSMSESFSVELNSINSDLVGYYDLSALKGLGVRMSADYDQKGRKMDYELAAFWDDDEIASIQMLVDNNKMSFASPQFTKGDAYGVNTETLGADLDRLGVEDGSVDVKDISFNIFDLAEAFMPDEGQTKEVENAVKQAGKELADAVEVTKTGKESIQVNGKGVDATAYHVVVPEGAMKDYVNALEDAMKLVDSQDAVKSALQAMGLPKDQVSAVLSEMKGADPYGELADTLKQGIKALGDLELDVYISGGYVSAVRFSERMDGTKVEVSLYLGGGDNYVDDLSLEITGGSDEILVESSGDHGGKSGVFTDETTIRLRSNKSDQFRLSSDFRYEPKAKNGNFQWELKADNVGSVAMDGQLTADKSSIGLKLDDVTLKAAGMKVCSLGLDYYVGPCKGMQVSMSNPKLLSDMDMDDLEDLYYDIEDNAEDWVYDMMDLIPSDLLWYLF